MTWFMRQRQDFIRAQLETFGMIRRADIADRFEVTIQVASADIQAFIADHPGAIDYDRTAKCYTYDSRADIVEALARQHGAREKGWQPIESAPKDGTEVDLFGYLLEASTKPVRITDCHYHCGEWLRWGYSEDEEGSHERIYRALFWMPLPAAPATDEGEAK